MAQLPEIVSKAWEKKEGAVVLTTVSSSGVPNSIYATCASKFSEDSLVVANNYFSKTMENIKNGSRGSLLFITPEKKSYQIKGKLEYHTSGKYFEDMKKWNPEKLPGHGAAVLKVEEVYSGGERLI
jgi:hypothetical protein